MKRTVELSIIILNFNTSSLTQQCLRSLVNAKGSSDRWEIIVVDNASTDGSPQELVTYIANDPQLRAMTTLIRNERNVGFSAGNNIGINASAGEYVLLLNSDTEVTAGAIQTVLERLAMNTHAGAATAKLMLPNGTLDPACHRGFPHPWAAFTYFSRLEKLFPHSRLFAQYHAGSQDLNQEHEVDAISGAFFMIKREVIERVGLLDEAFFMYGEDLDFAYRIYIAGYSILFIPSVTVLHKKKQSGRASTDKAVKKRTTISFYETMQLFYRKHYQKKYPPFVTWTILRLLDMILVLLRM
jgi:GT2 family glycosyltransferase